MSTTKKVEQLISQMENHLECWKQFNQFVGLARGKKFGQEDESQFLEIKSVLVQELEMILANIEVASPNRTEIHDLVGNAPSLRYLADTNEGVLRNLESQWHKIYIGWHAVLGQLKARQTNDDNKSGLGAMFSKKEK
jgi:hypothetical protein